ncbi:MAG: HlyC/CorC family transporter [Nevskiales bacterium]|nr:HlyC/CorC family transporter [Nevskiales bacterium]
MDEIPLVLLFGLLGLLIVLSGFFSGSEIALMTLNRYRLRHRAKQGHLPSKMAQDLLERPDRLIGLILLFNNIVQALIPVALLIVAQRLTGDVELSVLIATAGSALMIFIFSESMPKTLGALHPEGLGLTASTVYWPLMRVLWPVVALVNLVGNTLLRLFGVSHEQATQHSLSTEELRSVVAEAGALIPERHQKMLLSLLDLEKATVEDIMVPRNEIVGIDLTDPPTKIREQLVASLHTRLPLYQGSIDEMRGIIHLRNALKWVSVSAEDAQALLKLAREPYFIPEGTPLNQQLLNFQNQKRRIGFVVDEYGDIQGLVTLADILEEVVGEFTSDPAMRAKSLSMEADGSYLVSGTMTIRTLNRTLGWRLPTAGPRTINGLVLEQLEDMPKAGRKITVRGYQIEITDTHANAVKTARIHPPTEPEATPETVT